MARIGRAIGRTLVLVAVLFTSLTIVCGTSRSSWPIFRISWNDNIEEDLAGYKVHYGTRSGEYTYAIDVGNFTSVDIGEFIPGMTYYFVVTAYDTSGNESGPSKEVSVHLPTINSFEDKDFEICGYVILNGYELQMEVTSTAGLLETNFISYSLPVCAGETVDILLSGKFESYTTTVYGNFPVYLVNTETGERISDEKDVILGPSDRVSHVTLVATADCIAKVLMDNPNNGLLIINPPDIAVRSSTERAPLSHIGIAKLLPKVASGRNSALFEWSMSLDDALDVEIGGKFAPTMYYGTVSNLPNAWDQDDPTNGILWNFETEDPCIQVDVAPDANGYYPGFWVTVWPIYTFGNFEFYGDPINVSYLPSDNTPLNARNWEKIVDAADVSTVTSNLNKSVAGMVYTTLNYANTYAADELIRTSDVTAIRYDSLKPTNRLKLVPDNPAQ